MQTFATGREAKEFLVSCIVTQAQREGISLSDIERKMLYFSESAWTLPDIMEVNEAFDREYDQHEYEQKIGRLSRNFCADASKNNYDGFERWKAAVRALGQEDHYLLVLVAAGDGSFGSSDSSLTMRVAIGTVVGGLALVALYVLFRR